MPQNSEENSPVVDIRTGSPYLHTRNTPLYEPKAAFGGGGGGGGHMEPTVAIKDYVDARDDAIESRLSAKLADLPSKRTIWSAVGVVVGGIFTALAVLLGTMAFGSDRFNGGLSVSPVVAQAQAQQQKVDKEQDAKLQKMDQKLDILLQRSAEK